jgi:hypothetical protein
VVNIHDATTNIEENWKVIVRSVTAVYNRIKDKFEIWEPLIRYLEAYQSSEKGTKYAAKFKKLESAVAIAEAQVDPSDTKK